MNIKYYWEMDFQPDFIVDYPEDKRPFMALAGSALHEDMFSGYRKLMKSENATELKKRIDFKQRDLGYSLNRAIRDNKLKIVKVFDEKKKKLMRAYPDIVDYRTDKIIDLKTHYVKKEDVPDIGGRFITEEDLESSTMSESGDYSELEIPDGYENAWLDLKRTIEDEIFKKYKSQFKRYYDAYQKATNRLPEINIYIIMYQSMGTKYHDEEYKSGIRKTEPKGLSDVE